MSLAKLYQTLAKEVESNFSNRSSEYLTHPDPLIRSIAESLKLHNRIPTMREYGLFTNFQNKKLDRES